MAYLQMTLRRTARKTKPRIMLEQKGAPLAAKGPEIPRKAARTVKKNALKPIKPAGHCDIAPGLGEGTTAKAWARDSGSRCQG
jgi:hypothetical protein